MELCHEKNSPCPPLRGFTALSQEIRPPGLAHTSQPHIHFLLHPVHTSWCVASLCTPLCPPKHRTQHSVHYATVLLTALHINKLGAELGCWYTRPRSPPHPRVQLSPPPPLPATGAGLGAWSKIHDLVPAAVMGDLYLRSSGSLTSDTSAKGRGRSGL